MQKDIAFYRSPANLAISNSKVSDWQKSPSYYKARYIDQTVTKELTTSMMLGLMVDAAFSAGTVDAIAKEYEVKSKNNTEGKVVVTQSPWEAAHEISELLLSQPFYADILTSQPEFQHPLWGTLEASKIPVCGLPDVYVKSAVWNAGKPALIDLKVTAPGHMPYWHKWSIHAGYMRQLGLYRHLVSQELNVSQDDIACFHVVVGSTKDRTYPIKLYSFSPRDVEYGFNEFSALAAQLWSDTEFTDTPLTWGTCSPANPLDISIA